MDPSFKEYLEEMKKIQDNLLNYLDEDSNIEEKYQTLKTMFKDIKIHFNKYKISSLMHLLIHISNNHHREENFLNKIEEILLLFKKDLLKYISKSELFNIFKSNKRILLFLIEEKVINIDEFIIREIIESSFFQPEIEPFMNEKWFPKEIFLENQIKKIPNNFYEKRKMGENEEEICKIIRKDLIEEFIIYVNKNSYPLKAVIIPSIFETNNFLSGKTIDLIQYAAFFGSIQIFKYLILNGVEMEQSLWHYAIHGKDPEIIRILEENQIKPENGSYKEIFEESIKCHHTNFSNYILDNYLIDEKENLNDYIMIDALQILQFFLGCILHYKS